MNVYGVRVRVCETEYFLVNFNNWFTTKLEENTSYVHWSVVVGPNTTILFRILDDDSIHAVRETRSSLVQVIKAYSCAWWRRRLWASTRRSRKEDRSPHRSTFPSAAEVPCSARRRFRCGTCVLDPYLRLYHQLHGCWRSTWRRCSLPEPLTSNKKGLFDYQLHGCLRLGHLTTQLTTWAPNI